MKKQRLDEIQFARALAMFSVLLVHATSYGIVTLSPESTFYPIYTTLNSIGKMGVPVFFLLSGFVLFYAYFPREFSAKLVGDFYKKRIKYIVIPYIAVSFCYVLFYHLTVYHYPSQKVFFEQFIQFLIHGNASYHTYFLFVLIQFYLLFPILLWVFKKVSFIKPIIFILGLLIQLLWVRWNSQNGWVNNTAIVFLSYISFFFIGAQMGMYYQSVREWLIKNKGKMLLIFGFLYMITISVLAFMDYHIFANKVNELYANYSFYMISGIANYLWIGQGILASIFLLIIGLYLNEIRFQRVKNILLDLAGASFGIYLFHPVVLAIAGKIFVSGNSMMFHVYQLAILAIIFIVSWIVTKILIKIPFGWIFIGK